MEKECIKLMKRCIKIAEKGAGYVSPNPMVGAIIYDDNYRIISTGYHKKYGENHAERNAIINSKEEVRGKNIIVNLEPCVHYGKTPPCCELIIEKGIKRVIIGMEDPNPIVAGKGIKRLKEAGIEVIVGVLEEECRKLNEVFIKNQIKKEPYIVIKTASTLDGKIATKTGSSKWITDEYSRSEVQRLRNRYDAILTSADTVIKDNPTMSCRMKGGRNPVRIIIDKDLKTDERSKIYSNDGTRVIIVTKKIKEGKYPENVELVECPVDGGHINIKEAVKILYKEGIKSIMIEAGGRLNNAFIQLGMVDKYIQFIGPKILADKAGKNIVEGEDRDEISQCNNLKIISTKCLKEDIMITGTFIK